MQVLNDPDVLEIEQKVCPESAIWKSSDRGLVNPGELMFDVGAVLLNKSRWFGDLLERKAIHAVGAAVQGAQAWYGWTFGTSRDGCYLN